MKVRSKLLAGLLAISMVIPGLSPAAVYAASDLDSAGESTNAMILADFNFDSMNDGETEFDGGNAAAAIFGENVSLADHENNGKALSLGSGSYLDVTAADGSSLLTGWDDITISFDLKPTTTNSWILYAAPDTNSQTYQNEHYLGLLYENGNTLTVERYNNSGGRPGSLSGKEAFTPNEWHHVEIAVTEPKTVLTVNGEEIASSDSAYLLSDILKDASILQIGKANWGSGEYSDMQLDNLKITARIGNSVSLPESVSVMEGKSKTIAVNGISKYANPSISYESADTNIAVVDENGKITGNQAGTTEITAAISMGTAVKQLTTAITVEKAAEAVPVFSLDFDDESIGDASALSKGLSAYDGSPVYEAGRLGKAIRLDNYGLRLNQEDVGQNYTVSLWMKHDTALTDNQQILSLGHGTDKSENWLDIAGDRNNSGNYKIWTRNKAVSPNNWYYIDESVKQKTGEWTMLSLTGNGTDFAVYFNGQPVTLTGDTSASVIQNAANVLNGAGQDIFIGVNNWDSVFDGLVDDVTVYNQDLTAEDILALYEKQYTEHIAENFSLGDLTAVSENLTLPQTAGDTTVIWTSDHPDIISEDGTVTRQDSDTDVTLTAVFSLGSARVEKIYTATVKRIDPMADLTAAADALTIRKVTDTDLTLPDKGILDTTINWTSSNPSVLSNDGRIIARPAAGEGNAKVTLTAALSKGSDRQTKTFTVEVLEAYYGYVYGYITGDNDRTGSLHLACSKDGKVFTALNSNAGIHFAHIDPANTDKSLSTGIRFTEISFFRKADGTFGLAAPMGKDQKQLYLYDSRDLISYDSEILLNAGQSVGSVSKVSVSCDTAGSYGIYWTNGSSQYVNRTDDLKTLSAAEAASYTVPEITAETLPDGAKNGSMIGVTKTEYENLLNYFKTVSYQETEAIAAVTVDTAAEIKRALPDTVSISYDDGSSSAMQVDWDLDTPDFSKAGTYTVTGNLSACANPLITERPDPQILYDEIQKCYYFTASYPAYGNVDNGYDRIVLRKADTISGLSDAETEITVWTAPASGQMAKHVWAPELHQIDGKWYIFFAAGNSDNVWAIRPYVLVCQGEDPYNAENWKKTDGTAEIHAATSEDTNCFTHMSLDMTWLTNEDAQGNIHHYVIWAELSPSSLYIQEIDPAQPWAGKGKVTMLTTPEYGWERDSELVNEGPAILKHDGRIFCTFSASGTGPEYCIGLLYADESSDLMNPDSWTKLSYPLLTSSDVPGEYGPGHNSFTTDTDGNPVFVYHARSEECYKDQCDYASSDPLYDPCRHARVKNVHWSTDGLPILNLSADAELPQAARTVTVQVTVRQDSQETRNLSNAIVTGVKDVVETGAQIRPEISVRWGTAPLEENTDYTVAYGENKTGKGTVTITAAEGSRYTGAKTIEFKILASVIADISFDDLTDGLKGGNAVATVAGGSIELVDHEDGKAAKFVSNEQDFLNLKAADGSSLLTGYDEITISYDILLPSVSGTNWVLYAAPDSSMLSWGTNGNKERYLGVMVKDGNIEAERYHNNGSRPTNPAASMAADTWQHIDIVYTKDRTVLYLNGQRKDMILSSYQLTGILGNESIFQIGKANWAPGEYSSMTLDNFKIVAGTALYEQDKIKQAETEISKALGDTTQVIQDLTLLTQSSDGVKITWSSDNPDIVSTDGKVTVPETQDTSVTLTATIGEGADATTKTYTVTVLAAGNAAKDLAEQLALPYSTAAGKEVYGNITLPNTVDGSGSVTWSTDHPEIVNVNEIPGTNGYDPTPAGTVTRPAQDTDVTMTAHVTLGSGSADKTFTFTVKAAPKPLTEDDYTDYFFAYFTGEGHSDGEQIYFSASRDGLNWKTLNEGAPTLTSTLGEKGVRDPFIIRSFEGDKFYLIATDLKIHGGNGWDAAQQAGSQSLMVWESTDLVNWSKQRMVQVSASIDAGCTWAPEAAYDERTGEYVVFWASKVAGDSYAKQRLYYAKTRDFYSFTEPKVYIDYDQSSIDTTMIKANGSVYRYTKNEGGNTNQLGALTKTIFIEKGSDILGSFTQIPSDILNSADNQYVEGPTIYKLNKDDAKKDTWCLLVDDFGGGGYYPLLTTDLDSGEFTRLTSGYKLPGGSRTPRHGTPLRITAAEYAAVAEAYNAEKDTVTIYAAAYQNAKELTDTTLPAQVEINGVKTDVSWSWPSSKFTVPYQTVSLIGATADSSCEVIAKVEVLPQKDQPLAYFVDAGRADGKESKAFDAVSKLAKDTLKNKVPDQLYSETDRWGRNAKYNLKSEGTLDVTDKSQTGLYGENGSVNSLTWRCYLEAGTYTVTAGMREWWDGPRRMYLKISGDHTDAATSDLITVSKSNPTATESLTFQVKSDGIVTISIENQEDSDAPAVSWFAVAKGAIQEPDVSTEIIVDGNEVTKAAANKNGLTWKGYGLLSGNSTSDLLMDYKQESPDAYNEMLEVLFGGEHPLINHIKMEMGNDGNNSTGADSCTMRFENEEADASRSPGFALAADAKKINPDVKVSFLRWEMPAWVKAAWDSDRTGKGYEAVYKWYSETIFDAYEKYGYIVDYVDPDKNETRDPDEDFIKWFRKRVSGETNFPSYMDQAAKDAYHGIKIIASDENTTLNIVPSMRNDSELYDAVDAIGFHYSTGTQSSTEDYRNMADKDDKEVWYSEGCAVFSYTEYQKNKTDSYGGGTIGGYQSPLALADNFIASFVYSRKTHYIFQPAIGSFYEGAQYDHKELLSAREPWAGYIHYDPAIYMLQHFTKFSKNGWENKDNTAGIWRVIANASSNTSGNRGDLGHLVNESGNPSYLTLASPDKSAFSIILVNNSNKTLPYTVKAQNMDIAQGAALEIWETKTDSYMQYKGESAYVNGCYEVEIEPYSMVTLTTLDCNETESYQERLPEEREKTVLDTDSTGAKQDTTDHTLYADDFNYAGYDETYLAGRGNEPRYAVDFTGAWVVENGKLKQLLNQSVSEWNPNEPNTVIGDFRWMNYKAGVDVTVTGDGYAGINIRQQTGMGFEGSGYSLRITKDGKWTLKKRANTLATGQADVNTDGTYRLELEGRGAFITAWVDGTAVAVYNDPAPEYFGRIRLGCNWAETTFDNLKAETLEGYEPYATKLIDNASDDVAYTGNWNIIAGAGGSNNDWYRSTSTTSQANATFHFAINGGGFALIGANNGSAVLDIEADEKKVAENVSVQASSQHCASYIQYGLADGAHDITVTVKSGTFVLDAIHVLPYNEANNSDRIVSVEPVYGAAFEGSAPQLPDTVLCTKQSGEQVVEEVTWQTENFRGKAYETTLASGITNDSGTPVSAKVEVIPAKANKLVYFIDASRDAGKESLAFDLIDSIAGNTLKNKVADQEYNSDSKWGRTGNNFREKGTSGLDITDKYQTGWYSSSKTEWLTYQLYLEAGDYELTAGFCEWWNNRSMKISVSGESIDKVTSQNISISQKGDSSKGSVTFTVKEDGIALLEIENAAANGEAPVLSWFGVASLKDDSAIEESKSKLQQTLNSYRDLDAAVYTSESWKIFEAAKNAAENLLALTDVTAEELDEAEQALRNAFGKLVTKEFADAQNSLRAEIEKYKDTDSSLYTANSYQVFADALKNAQDTLADESSVVADFNLAKAALTDAFGKLVTIEFENARNELQAEIEKYADINASIYTDDSYRIFESALQHARDVLADESSAVADFNSAKAALTDAFGKLVTVEFENARNELQAEIEKYADINASIYTDDSYRVFEKALQHAQNVLADESSAVTDFTKAKAALTDAFGKLVIKDLAEAKDALRAEIEKYAGINASLYTTESYQPFADALQHAKNVLADDSMTAADFNAAKAALTDAFNKLVTKELAAARNELRSEIEKYKNTDSAPYTENSYLSFANALSHAQDVLTKDSTAAELNAAKTALTEAFRNLITKTLAEAQNNLRKELEKYADTDSSIYTAVSYQIFANALQHAKNVLAKKDSTAEDLNAAKEAVTAAFGKLVTNAYTDAKADLLAEINKYQSLDFSGYTAESYQIVADALAAAIRVLNDSASTPEQLAQAKAALAKAYAGLTVSKTEPPVTTTKTALTAPTVKSVKSTAGKSGSQVTIVLNKVANADSYTVFRKIGSKVTKIGVTTTGTIVDTKPVSGKKASYYAVASSGDTLKYTDSVAGAAKSITIARDTTKVTVKRSGKKVTISYKKVKNAKGYLIYRSTKKNGAYTKLTKKPVKKTSYTDKTAKSGKTYYYKVVVVGKNTTYSAGKVSKKVKIK